MIHDFLKSALDFCWKFLHLFQQEDWSVIFLSLSDFDIKIVDS